MEPNIAEMLRSTAKNMSELFLMLANRVEQLEQENQELREKLEQK
jgi:hypothetical protein